MQVSHAADTAPASAAGQPTLPASEVQTGAQGDPSGAKGPSAVRSRPRVAARPRAAKAAQQVNPKADVQQQQQVAADDSQTRYLRMMQESGVTPEEMEEAY